VKTKGVMLIIYGQAGGPRFVPCESREEAEVTLKIIERMGYKDVNGTPITVEVAEYEDTPL